MVSATLTLALLSPRKGSLSRPTNNINIENTALYEKVMEKISYVNTILLFALNFLSKENGTNLRRGFLHWIKNVTNCIKIYNLIEDSLYE